MYRNFELLPGTVSMDMTILKDTRITIPIIALPVLAACAVIWWWLPRHQVARLALKIRDPKARADVEDNFRKTVGQGLAAAVALFGAGLTASQFLQQQQTAHDQLVLQQDTMDRQQKTARLQLEQQQKSAGDLLISNQVSKGFEQLASKDVIMRLGGIYALEGVMNASEQYRVAVLEALCAFVRDKTRDIKTEKNTDSVPPNPAIDIQAVLTVIGRRVEGPGLVNLAGAQIPKTVLPQSNLINADLRDAKLQGANLIGADLDLSLLVRADLARTYLQGATLRNANLEEANLQGAILRNADLRSAYLRAAILQGADLRGAKLQGAELGGEDQDHPGADFSDADLTGASFDDACGTGIKGLPAGLILKPCLPR